MGKRSWLVLLDGEIAFEGCATEETAIMVGFSLARDKGLTFTGESLTDADGNVVHSFEVKKDDRPRYWESRNNS
jgi:hypothetical protein